uniref:Uncharacterized protein n=1 Tax=Oryza barthii TaxID=65489 RepID=A0A0D3FYK3_9ORYZ
MQPPCLGACSGGLALPVHRYHRLSSASRATVSCAAAAGGGKASPRGKENVWSGKDAAGSRVLVSGAMLVEVETVLQTQSLLFDDSWWILQYVPEDPLIDDGDEAIRALLYISNTATGWYAILREPVIKPSWDTFASSLSGVWKGVGAVFSPITAEMEPVGVGSKQEYLYDCYTLSHIEKHADNNYGSVIRRKTNWVQLNPHGEAEKQSAGYDSGDQYNYSDKRTLDLPAHESFDLKKSDVLDEDSIAQEPGIDGSYSRGPVDLAIGEFDESKYFISPTYKFEQCLVKGCHKRLRIVHTIELNEGGANIQIVRIAVYEEKWVSPAHIHVEDDTPVDVKPLSQRKRTKPSDLTGSWKVYEVSATPIFSEERQEIEGGALFVYLCMETVKKRSLPESSVFFGEEEMLDMQDVTMLWLPGGVTAYVDVDKDGILCIGVGWYSDEGINMVMERDYGTDGKLRDVRWKTEVKRRWNQPVLP